MNTIDGHIFIFILCHFSWLMFCSFHIQQNNNLSFLRLSQGAFSLSCKQCATFCIQHINNLSFRIGSEGGFSLSGKQCATFVFNILNNLSFCIGSEGGFSSLTLSQAVCNFHIQHISILSFITWSEGTFYLSHKQCFLVYGSLFYLCISGVLIVMFFTGLCFGAFICLVFLVDGLPSLLFYRQGFSFFFLFQLYEKKCWW
jgi:hypothetical protein